MIKQCVTCAVLASAIIFLCGSDTMSSRELIETSVGETAQSYALASDAADREMYAPAGGESIFSIDVSELKPEAQKAKSQKELPPLKEPELEPAKKNDSASVSKPKKDTPQETKKLPPALTEEQFSLLLAEAKKYLGYEYVWGGSSPKTSFDCSGYVSWVVNNSGIGINIGRTNAKNIYKLCTKVSSSQLKPGDLVFFKGTYATTGVSHVGIYIGDGQMIHCGSSVSYADLNQKYWKSHFYAYGRLPNK